MYTVRNSACAGGTNAHAAHGLASRLLKCGDKRFLVVGKRVTPVTFHTYHKRKCAHQGKHPEHYEHFDECKSLPTGRQALLLLGMEILRNAINRSDDGDRNKPHKETHAYHEHRLDKRGDILARSSTSPP